MLRARMLFLGVGVSARCALRGPNIVIANERVPLVRPRVVDAVKCPRSSFYFYLRHFNIDYFTLVTKFCVVSP